MPLKNSLRRDVRKDAPSKSILHIYTRVSTSAQAEKGTSLDTQLKLGKEKARHLKFKWRHWDEGGKSSHHEDIERRPTFYSLYQAIRDGEVKHLWVYDQSRLSRNDQVASIFRYQCNKQGVTLYTKDGTFDLSSPSDKLLKQMLDAVAEFENSARAERSRIGKLAKVKQGYWHGGPPPYGYKISNGRLAENPLERKWVRAIFAKAMRGASAAKIKQFLDENGVLARRGGLWAIGSIEALLQNTHYQGYYSFQDSVSEESVRVECPSLIDETTWSAVQAERKARLLRKNQRNATTRNFYLLRDFLFCGHCGRKLSGRIKASKGEAFYYCPNKERAWVKNGGTRTPYKRGTGCGLERSLNIPLADKAVFETVVQLHKKSSILKEEVKQRIYSQFGIKQIKTGEQIQELQRQADQLERRLNEVRRTRGILHARNLVGELDDIAFKAATRQVEETETRLQVELSNVRLNLRNEGGKKQWVDWVTMFGQEIDDKKTLAEDQRQSYLAGLIERIDVKFDAKSRDHQLTIHFGHPIVGDRIQWHDPKKKALGYSILEGSKEANVRVERRVPRGR